MCTAAWANSARYRILGMTIKWVATKHCGRAMRSRISDTHRLRSSLQFRYINNQSSLYFYDLENKIIIIYFLDRPYQFKITKSYLDHNTCLENKEIIYPLNSSHSHNLSFSVIAEFKFCNNGLLLIILVSFINYISVYNWHCLNDY